MGVNQSREMAHLRVLPVWRCGECGVAATQELVNGVNARVGVYCDRCAPRMLKKFKEQGNIYP